MDIKHINQPKFSKMNIKFNLNHTSTKSNHKKY
jgi:hypothetical protein